MFLTRLLGLFRKLFVATTLALPHGKNCIRIAGALVNRALRWNNFATTLWAGSAPRRATINIDLQKCSVISHE